MSGRKAVISCMFVAILSVLLSISAEAWNRNSGPQRTQQNQAGVSSVPSDPRELIRRVVQNELKANENDHTRYMYKDRRQTTDGSKTKLMIETNQGTVAYLIAVNDRPVTAEQRVAEDRRLQEFAHNPAEQAKKKKEQQQDNSRVVQLFRELPNAFLYQYDGMLPGNNGHEWVKLKFQPDPKYDPPSRETSVFKAMTGTMVVDPSMNRLAKIEATLFRDMTFGWGILGHLDKGGHFFVEQTNIGDSRWEPTYMNIQFTGKILFFKTINLRQIESTGEYVRVSDSLTLNQGIDILKKRAEGSLAENNSARAHR